MAEGPRHSRIRHPPGGGFIRLDKWAVGVLGPAGAAALSVLEFWDQLNDGELEWMRRDVADLVAALAGLYARDKVRAARRELVGRGWLEEQQTTELDGQLYRTKTWLLLRTDRINSWIEENTSKSKECEISHSGNAKSCGPEGREIATNTNSKSKSKHTPTPIPRPQAGDTKPPGGREGEEDHEQEKDKPQAGQGVRVVGLEALERLQQGLAAAIMPLIVNLPLERAQALVDRLVGDMRGAQGTPHAIKYGDKVLAKWISQRDSWQQSLAGAAVAKAREAETRRQAALAAQPQIDEHAAVIGTALLPPNMAARAAAARRTG